MYDNQELYNLHALSTKWGWVYGSDLISRQLYLIIKREKLKNIVEIGSGLGISSFWIGQALKENKTGTLHSFDSGKDSQKILSQMRTIKNALLEKKDELALEKFPTKYYFKYLRDISTFLNLDSYIKFHCKKIHSMIEIIQEIPGDSKIDLVFSDFRHGPSDILDILSTFLPYMNENSHILIDSVPSNEVSRLTIEQLIEDLNNSKIPSAMLGFDDKEHRWRNIQLITQRKFKLNHIVELDSSHQNSTAWISIEPIKYTVRSK